MKRFNWVKNAYFRWFFSVDTAHRGNNFRLLRLLDFRLRHSFCDFFWGSSYGTCLGPGPGPPMGIGSISPRILCRNVYIGQRPGQEPGSIFPFLTVPFSILEAIRASKYTWSSLFTTGHICPYTAVWITNFLLVCQGQRIVHITSSINSFLVPNIVHYGVPRPDDTTVDMFPGSAYICFLPFPLTDIPHLTISRLSEIT